MKKVSTLQLLRLLRPEYEGREQDEKLLKKYGDCRCEELTALVRALMASDDNACNKCRWAGLPLVEFCMPCQFEIKDMT